MGAAWWPFSGCTDEKIEALAVKVNSMQVEIDAMRKHMQHAKHGDREEPVSVLGPSGVVDTSHSESDDEDKNPPAHHVAHALANGPQAMPLWSKFNTHNPRSSVRAVATIKSTRSGTLPG